VSDLLVWLEGTALATWTRESPSIWAYPTVLTLHTVGLGLVVGMSLVVDLRLLGVASRIRLSALAGLFKLIAWAFVLNAITGVLLFMSDATTKGRQPILYLKLGIIAVALWVTWLARRLVRSDADVVPDAPAARRARLVAVSSLALWAAAITAGRLMAYL
jgi:hypothetical protein